MKHPFFLFLIVFICLCGDLIGQITETSNDSLVVNTDSTSVKRNTFKEIFSGNPGRAALFSLIVPGGGQIYNKRWIKLPLIYALEGGAAAWLYYNADKFKYYDNIFDDLVKGIIDNQEGFTSPSQAKVVRDKYRKNKEYAVVYMILAHIYNIFDAYVDRHLMEFDISEDISIKLIQDNLIATRHYASISLEYRF